MFTYSTNLHGTVTATLNTLGNSAILDDEEEKVNYFFFLLKINFQYSFIQ
jgi:hypothetical protein